MKITKPEHLDRLDKDGLIAFLYSDCEDKIALWNAWRGMHVLDSPNLRGANLLKAYSVDGISIEDTFGVHLSGIDLSAVDMSGADLTWAHMESADLTNSHFRGIKLMAAHLEDAVLGLTHLEEASLDGAHAERAILFGAYLEGANLYQTHLEGANLQQAHLKDVALSPVASLRGVHLYQTYFWGVLSLRYEQFLDERGHSTIWEETEGRFSEAKDVYKSLKGYFEDAGDYEGANWAFGREQVMEKWMITPRSLRWLYPRWRGKWQDGFCAPNLTRWLGLELSDKLAGYGLSLWRPFFALAAVVLLFALIYWLGGTITSTPGCSYAELTQQWRAGCAPTSNPLDALLFSLGALISTEIGSVRPYLSHVGLLMTLEVLLGIALTGLFGFVLGNKLRYS